MRNNLSWSLSSTVVLWILSQEKDVLPIKGSLLGKWVGEEPA
jgi:hypothetical protein